MRWLALIRDGADATAEDIRAACEGAAEVARNLPQELDTRPRPVDVFEGYAAYDSYGDKPTPLHHIEEEIVAQLTADFPMAGSVVDVGCGAGRHARRLQQHYDVTGVDLAPNLIARAQTEVLGATFVVGDMLDLPFEDDTFDAALSSLAVGHVEDLATAVREMARVVKPGGQVVIAELHPATTALGGQVFIPTHDGMLSVRKHVHWHKAYTEAFMAAGLEELSMHEVHWTPEAWKRLEVAAPETAHAFKNIPGLLAWHLRVVD